MKQIFLTIIFVFFSMLVVAPNASANNFKSFFSPLIGDCDEGDCDFTLDGLCDDSECRICNPTNPPYYYPGTPPDSACHTTHFWREIYIGNPTCLVTVYYHIRKCATTCANLRCQLNIDEIYITPQVNGCLTCSIPNSEAAMKIMLRSIEKELLKSQAFGNPCGPNPPLPNTTYGFTVGKSICWKRTDTYVGGVLTGPILKATFTPCRLDACCLSKYCVKTGADGYETVTLCDTRVCPGGIENCQEDKNGNPVEGCDNSTWFVCGD